ncbi:hypothetical protein DRO49_05360 [Candidatus Bathyarchaeota archaeon]|nr:MAG: hypothetical protein DRO49_05360 [Candidatus Bathyarchaeota archaeon]
MRKVLIFGSVVICLLFLTSTASASWWNVNWKYRREITITNVNGTLTDYQILVELNSSNFNFSHAQENGSDIRFVASDDETLLNHWIEGWNSTNQSAKIWVKVPEVEGGTKIFMYYGNENASDASNANTTFIRVIDGVVGAWHFDEGNGTTAHDTSGEGNNGTLYDGNTTNDDGNTPPQWIDGKFGEALSFDGVDDYVEVPDSPELRATTLTITAWVKLAELGRDHAIAVKRAVGTTNEGWRFLITSNNNPRFMFYDGAEWRSVTFSNLVLDKEWHFVAVVHDENTGTTGYLDDTSEFVSNPYAPQVVTVPVVIGWTKSPPDIWMNGTIDEVRIYNRALSEEEISELYNNYGYTTPNYPNKVLVRKYTEPEPVAIVGEEVSGIFTAIANFLTIEKEIGANYILWKWSCTNPDALVDVFVDGSEVLSAVSAVSGEYLLTDVNENELHIIKIANSFNASDYVRDRARTLPPFSFFLALLLTTFVLLVITFATTSTVRVIASIFTLLFTASTYKYSIYYASPLSYLLLFAFFFTFALMLVEVLRMLTSTIRKKPKWEEDFWSEWREGGGRI